MIPAPVPPARRGTEHGPMTPAQFKNAQRLATYEKRKQGVEEPRIQLWRP